MAEHGDPISYLMLPTGIPVFSSDDQHVGTVHRVLADERADIFDGLILDTEEGKRFVDAPAVGDLYERAAFLDLTAAQARHLHAPEGNPPVLGVDADDADEGVLRRRLRETWNLISGKY
ncbi:MAG TPA: hypothetical protein VGV40_11425 [Solirubrobacteraceae bacterium]|nr:hypothetical protein [Solirubrobacteraceae bacterium]